MVDTNIKKIILILVTVLTATGILMVSVSRATLEVMVRDENEGRLRVVPVIVQDKIIYKLPQTNMLPNNIFYGIKESRDWLWLKFSPSDEKKAKILLILADKRIAEALALAKRGKHDLALKTGAEAINKLKYANGLINNITLQPIAQKQLTVQVWDTTMAYSGIIREIGQQIIGDKQKYNLLQQNIDDFKEEQRKEEATQKE
ncbi:MAG: DUF5667 domain-containing protein [Candidatus Shapirobacteria bacterium]